jgi:MFS family permease
VALGIGVTIGATTLLAAVPSALAVGLILAVALAPSVVRPLLSARLNDLIPSAQRATILSLASLVFTLAIAVAEPVLLAIADAFDAPTAIGVCTVVYAVTVIPLAVLWRSAERRAPLAAEPVLVPEVAEAMPR